MQEQTQPQEQEQEQPQIPFGNDNKGMTQAEESEVDFSDMGKMQEMLAQAGAMQEQMEQKLVPRL